MLMYLDANKDIFPRSNATPRWNELWLPYCGDAKQVFYCPSDTRTVADWVPAEVRNISYGYNILGLGHAGTTAQLNPALKSHPGFRAAQRGPPPACGSTQAGCALRRHGRFAVLCCHCGSNWILAPGHFFRMCRRRSAAGFRPRTRGRGCQA